jgi:peptidyl-tRNA hydrolase
VLAPFPPDERRALDELLDPMADAVESWVEHGIERAMAVHNRS